MVPDLVILHIGIPTSRTAEKLYEVDDFRKTINYIEDTDGESKKITRWSPAIRLCLFLQLINITSDDFDGDRDIQKSRTGRPKTQGHIIPASLFYALAKILLFGVSSRNLSSFSMSNHLYQLDVTHFTLGWIGYEFTYYDCLSHFFFIPHFPYYRFRIWPVLYWYLQDAYTFPYVHPTRNQLHLK